MMNLDSFFSLRKYFIGVAQHRLQHSFYSFLRQKSLVAGVVFITIMLGSGQKVVGQKIYAMGGVSGGYAFRKYNYTFDTWTSLTPSPNGLTYNLVYAGSNFYCGAYTDTGILYMYDEGTDSWATKAAFGSVKGGIGSLAFDGTFIYGTGSTRQLMPSYATLFKKYDIATNTWSNLAIPPFIEFIITADGNNDIYAISKKTAAATGTVGLAKYNKVANTWTTLASPTDLALSLIYHQGALYAGSLPTFSSKFAKYDIATNTWASLASPGLSFWSGAMTSDGSYIYAGTSAAGYDFKKYNIGSNTWATLSTDPFEIRAMAAKTECTPTATVTVIQPTCTGAIPNSDGKIQLSSITGVTKADYSVGSSYTGNAYGAAQNVSGVTFDVITGLANTTYNKPYTVRMWCDASKYKDKVVMMQPKVCINAELAVSVVTTPQTANSGEIVTYTITANNNGPDTAPDAMVDVRIPTNTTFLNAQPNQGTYNQATQVWDIGSIANGVSKILVLTLKMN